MTFCNKMNSSSNSLRLDTHWTHSDHSTVLFWGSFHSSFLSSLLTYMQTHIKIYFCQPKIGEFTNYIGIRGCEYDLDILSWLFLQPAASCKAELISYSKVFFFSTCQIKIPSTPKQIMLLVETWTLRSFNCQYFKVFLWKNVEIWMISDLYNT